MKPRLRGSRRGKGGRQLRALAGGAASRPPLKPGSACQRSAPLAGPQPAGAPQVFQRGDGQHRQLAEDGELEELEEAVAEDGDRGAGRPAVHGWRGAAPLMLHRRPHHAAAAAPAARPRHAV
jgi:hypothetical protein